MSNWEPVIGLEVHVQLATATKLFCSCPNRFGAAPNSLVCPVCLGLPGSLPVPSRAAFSLAVRAALAFGCAIHQSTRFDRKNYFYPDLPKGYQISQLDFPFATGGAVPLSGSDTGPRDGPPQLVPLVRIHLEEDAGKSLHDPQQGVSRVDLNRCGTPLLEMVTEPALFSPEAAGQCLRTIRELVRWLEISDGNMEEGSLRCDVNISLRPAGSTPLGTRTEIKNLNSFSHVERALELEIERQRQLLEAGGQVTQETRLFDEDQQVTRPMRSKEEADDYRYFPDPDLPGLEIPAALISAERTHMPELPEARRRRYREELGLSAYDAQLLTAGRDHSEYFEELVAAGVAAKIAANWLQGEILRELNESGMTLAELPLAAAGLASLVKAVEDGRLGASAARTVLRRVVRGEDLTELLASATPQVTDEERLQTWVREVIEAHADAADKVRAGDDKPLAYLMGQVMKRSRGAAHAQRVNELLRQSLLLPGPDEQKEKN